jgi:hypothetical protein
MFLLSEEHRLSVFKYWLLRKMFQPKRDKVTEDWRKLHNEKLYDYPSSPNIIWVFKSKSMKWARDVVHIREKLTGYREGGRKEGRPLGRHRHKWEANIKMNQEMGWEAGLD